MLPSWKSQFIIEGAMKGQRLKRQLFNLNINLVDENNGLTIFSKGREIYTKMSLILYC